MNLFQDLRFAVRQLRKSLAFTLLAAGTLAIDIGSATAVFSLVETVLLRPLPFAQPDRVMALGTKQGVSDGPQLQDDTSYPSFFDWRNQAKGFSSLASYQFQPFTFGSPAGPVKRIDGMVVSSDFFTVVGVKPAQGRGFLRAEENAGNRSVILSEHLWRNEFQSNAAMIGRQVRLNDENYTVVGVLPKGFVFPGSAEAQVWITSAGAMEGANPSGRVRGWHQLQVLGRLAPGVSLQQASAEMQIIQKKISELDPDSSKNDVGVTVIPELQSVVGDVSRPLHILFGAVCFLLLIACANLAGLLLARTNGRRSELAVRSALGASRMEITRQLLLESVMLALVGGSGGVAIAAIALKLAPQYLPANLPRAAGLGMNGHVLGFAIAASLLTSLLFGALPAWRMSKLDPAMALRDNSRGSTASKGQKQLHGALIIGETALGLILMVGAGLMIRSFVKTMDVDPGFSPQGLLSFRVAVPSKRFDDPHSLQFAEQVQQRLDNIPGVKKATYSFPMPFTGSGMSIGFKIEGRPAPIGEDPAANASVVAPNFFETLQVPLLEGRFFTGAEEQPKSPPVVIVNEAFAKKFFPGEEALGKRINPGLSNEDKSPMREIVGVVNNVPRADLTAAPESEYYIPYAQATVGTPVFALRATGDLGVYSEPIKKILAEQSQSIPVYFVRPFTELLSRSTAQQRFQTILLGAFAGIALLLSAIGLYAVLSYTVTQRRLELGLRMALGAARGDVLGLVMKRGLMLTVGGLALGLIASAVLTRFLATLLFATKALDVLTFAAMTLLLLVVSMLACLAPAYQASRLDPNKTLRDQ